MIRTIFPMAGRERAHRVMMGAVGLGIFLVFLSAGCTGNENAASRSEKTGPGSVAGSISAANPPDGTAGTAARLPEETPPPPARIRVGVLPPFPSRVSPPFLLVDAPPSVKDRKLQDVVWIVNDLEIHGGDRMEPELFQKGDRIRARGTVLVENQEIAFETPEIVARNSPPEIEDARLEPKAPTTGIKVRLIASGKDADGDAVVMKYQWFIDDKEVPGEGEELTLTGVKRGSWVHAKVSTNDGTDEGSWKFTSKYQVVNSLPVVNSRLPAEVPPDTKFTYRINAEDPDGDELTYALVKSPPGMVLSGSTLEWEVPDDMLGSQVEVVVNISDGNGGQTVCTLSMQFHQQSSSRSPISHSRTGS